MVEVIQEEEKNASETITGTERCGGVGVSEAQKEGQDTHHGWRCSIATPGVAVEGWGANQSSPGAQPNPRLLGPPP